MFLTSPVQHFRTSGHGGSNVQQVEIDAVIGETIRIGGCLVTILEVEGEQVIVRIENSEMNTQEEVLIPSHNRISRPGK